MASPGDVILRPRLYRRDFGLRNLYLVSEGNFQIENVTPGSYKVFVWEDLEPYSYFDSEVLRQYEQAGTAVKIGEGADITTTVRIIAANGHEGYSSNRY